MTQPLHRLAEFCYSIDYGLTASASAIAAGPRFLRITDIVGQGIDWGSVPSVVCSAEEAVKYRLHHGDVVIARTGATTGYSAYVSNPPEAVFASYLVRLRVSEDNDPRYVAYALKSSFFWEWIASVMDEKAAQPNASASTMAMALLPKPSKDRQAEIARILGSLDDKIDLNRRMCATLEEMARAIFRSWFVDFDPVRAKVAAIAEGRDPERAAMAAISGKRDEADLDTLPPETLTSLRATAALFPPSFSDSELGEIPDGWMIKTLTEEFDVVMGQSPPGETYNTDGEGLPFYQGRSDFGFRFPRRRVHCTAPTRRARPGDTLMSVRAPVGTINMATEECAIGRGVGSFRHTSGASAYTYEAVHSYAERFETFDSEGTVFGSVSKADLARMHVVSPCIRVVHHYEERVAALFQMIETLDGQSRAIAALRDTLLPKLLSGEVVVPDAKELPRA